MIEQIKTLETQIEQWDKSYYTDGVSLVSDDVYDITKQKLKDLYEVYQISIPEYSVLHKVGHPLSVYAKKIQLQPPMYSLDFAKDIDGIHKFVKSTIKRLTSTNKPEYVSELKYDGLAIEIFYDRGELIYAITRGDKKEGANITNNFLLLIPDTNVPRTIDYMKPIKIRGEVILPKPNLEAINSFYTCIDQHHYKNTRNGCSALLRKELSETEIPEFDSLRPLVFIPYELIDPHTHLITDPSTMTLIDVYKFIEDLGIQYSWFLKDTYRCITPDMDDISKFYNHIKNQRPSLMFDIDGIVVKVLNINQQLQLGYTERVPRWSMAWKFPPKGSITKLIGLELSVNEAGTITPVGIVEPTQVGDIIVNKVALFNFPYIESKNIQINSTVEVIRSGDVIPVITSCCPDEFSTTIKKPTHCPICGSIVVNEGKRLKCSNVADICPQLIKDKNKTTKGLAKITVRII